MVEGTPHRSGRGPGTGYVRIMATTAGYGRWPSPLASADVARAKVSLSELCSDGDTLYWLESRPAEGGRVVLVRAGDDGPRDHSPPEVSIRSRVHEYGGGALCLLPANPGAFAFVDQTDQRVWMCTGEGYARLGSTPQDPVTVWLWRGSGDVTTARPASTVPLPAAAVSRAESFTLTGRRGTPVYGTLYRPPRGDASHEADAPGGPPLVVWCHGGPTAACSTGLDLAVQFFTTRGFAVACVDYAGSTGYGRSYRCSLWGEWGVADAEDCLDAARHLAARGRPRPGRMAVRGASAGGMTALNALASGEGFAACASLYGVTDLLALAATTHDFEAHYTDRLIGPLPEAQARYVARSPVSRAHDMVGAVLLLQGTEDAVVPPAQAELMREALVVAGVPCDLRFFGGEGHGFRRAETLAAGLETELAFYLEHLRL